MEKLRQAHAKEKKEALAEFRSFKRSAKAREESMQAIYYLRTSTMVRCWVQDALDMQRRCLRSTVGESTNGCLQAQDNMNRRCPHGNAQLTPLSFSLAFPRTFVRSLRPCSRAAFPPPPDRVQGANIRANRPRGEGERGLRGIPSTVSRERGGP